MCRFSPMARSEPDSQKGWLGNRDRHSGRCLWTSTLILPLDQQRGGLARPRAIGVVKMPAQRFERDRFGGARCDDGGDDAAGRGSGRPPARQADPRPNVPRANGTCRPPWSDHELADQGGTPRPAVYQLAPCLAQTLRMRAIDQRQFRMRGFRRSLPDRTAAAVSTPPPSRSKIAPLPLPRIKPRPPKDANREI